ILRGSASSTSMEKGKGKEEHQQREPKKKCLSKAIKCSALRKRQSTLTTPDLRRRYQSLHYLLNCHLLI
ncbi:DPPA4 isoform 4, partial [Pan troglodytes]